MIAIRQDRELMFDSELQLKASPWSTHRAISRACCVLAVGLSIGACGTRDRPSLAAVGTAELRATVDSLPISSDRISGAFAVGPDWVTAEASTGSISRIGPSGEMLWTASRQGRGPGEFLAAKLLGIRDSGVVVYDRRQRKLAILSQRDGSTISESTIELISQYYSSEPIAVLAFGMPVMRAATLDYRGHVGVVRPLAALVAHDRVRGTREIAAYRESELVRETDGNRTIEMLRPLGQRSGVASCQNRIWTFDGDSLYSFREYNGSWRRSNIPLPSRTRIPASEPALDSWIRSEFPPLADLGNPVGAVLRRHLDLRSTPLWGQGGASYESPLLCSSGGAIYLRAFTGAEPERWWRRGKDGDWRELMLPQGVEIIAFGDSVALARATDQSAGERASILRWN